MEDKESDGVPEEDGASDEVGVSDKDVSDEVEEGDSYDG